MLDMFIAIPGLALIIGAVLVPLLPHALRQADTGSQHH